MIKTRMNRFVNKILKDPKENINDDPFFQPKDMKKRKEKERKKRNEFLSKIKLGLQNIKEAYENKKWDSKEEKLFLKIFFKFHLSDIYSKKYEAYYLLNEKNIKRCLFDLHHEYFYVSNLCIWQIFEQKFDWDYDEIQSFMRNMIYKYFKLNEFTIENWFYYSNYN